MFRRLSPSLIVHAWRGVPLFALATGGALSPAVSQGWQIETVAASTSSNFYWPSLALDSSGNPHVAYLDETKLWLMYAWKDSEGWHSTPVDTFVGAEHYVYGTTAIAIGSNGYARIAYHRVSGYGGGGLSCFACASDTGWGLEAPFGGYNSSIGADRGLALRSGCDPYISRQPCNVYGGCNHMIAWKDTIWHQETVEDNGGWMNVAVECGSLALDAGGLPRSAYRHWSSSRLHYAQRNRTGWHIEDVAPMSGDGYVSLALASDGTPHISFPFNAIGDAGSLNYAHRGPSGWVTEVVVAPAVFASSVALDPWGNTHIAYNLNDLNLAYALRDSQGWHFQVVDSAGIVGGCCSLCLDADGCSHIVYVDWTNHDIRYARSTVPVAGTLSGQVLDSQVVLQWIPIVSASAYWVYGAPSVAHFVPGVTPDFAYRLAVVPAGTLTWASGAGVYDPDANWTYLVIAVNGEDSEIWRSDRCGEHDYDLP